MSQKNRERKQAEFGGRDWCSFWLNAGELHHVKQSEYLGTWQSIIWVWVD
jgi:hypothetical protein